MSELDELVRQRRFEEIYQARQQVDEDKRNLDDAVASGKISDSLARRLYQRSVDRYVKQLETLLNPPRDEESDDDEDGPNPYWTDVRVGEIRLPDGDVLVVRGLLGYLNLQEEIEVEMQLPTRSRYFDLGGVETVTRTVQPPWTVLESAVRTANSALADLGMEIEPDRRQDIFEVKNDPDDYAEPVSNDIPKPKPPS